MTPSPPPAAQRLDKWLWHARFGRTRGAAQQLIEAGAIRVNRLKATRPSQPVREGDILTIAIRDRVQVIRVIGIVERRVGAALVATLFQPLATEESDVSSQANGLLAGDDQTG